MAKKHSPAPWAWRNNGFNVLEDAKGQSLLNYYTTDDGVHCSNKLDAPLIEAAPELLEGASFADGCFQAAFAEGWIEALADGDLERIRDIWNRRLSMACDKITPAMAKATKA